MLTGAALSVTFGGLAMAQTAPSSTDSSSSDVVVTGSRIKSNAFTSPDPIQVISAEQAQLAGYADTASLLQQSSIAAGSFQTNDQLAGYVVTGGPGAKTLDLRGLGAQRTIILLDGKRLGPAGVGGTVGPVDLNVIALSAVDHIEILKDGASSLYGSDAVAGVVNIITKKKRDGGDITLYTGQSEKSGGDIYQINGSYGKTWDKGYLNVAGEFYQQESLDRGQRSYTNCSEDYLFNPNGGGRVDYTDTVTSNYGHTYKCYNSINNVINTSAYGYVQYLQPGVTYPTAAQGNNVSTTVLDPALGGGPLSSYFARQGRAGYPATYPYANYQTPLTDRVSVVSPDTHYNVNANAGYDLSPYSHLYGQFQFSDRLSYQTGNRQLFPTLGAAWVNGNPNNVFAGTGVTPVYPVIELPSDYTQDVKYYRGVIGIKGDVTGLGWFNRFNYDVYGTYSKSSATYSSDAIYNDRVVATTTSAAACNPATPNLSNFNCSSLPAGGIPWLSSRVLSGAFTPAERSFLFFKTHGTTDYDQYILEGDFAGDLFNLPAGPLGSAFGFDYRHDSIDDRPDPQTQLGNLWGQTAAGRTKGSDAVKEAYGELRIPVIKNFPLIHDLSFDISGRYSDYDSYGSTGTYKVTGNWAIIPDFRFRGSVGTSFRAPDLYELYLAHQTGFLAQQSVDPCFNYGSSGVSQVVQNYCAKLGIPNNYTGTQNPGGGASATIYTGGGKGNLTAETSQEKTIGFVFTPKHFGIDRWSNLSIAVDYIDIQVHNEVTTFGSANIITQCAQGNTAFCTLFTRDLNPASPTYFNILSVNNNYVNVARQGVRGLDATIHADHNFGAWGKLSLESNLTWTFSNKTALIGGSIVDYTGGTYNYAGPAFAGNAQLRWDYRDWTVFWYTTMLGKASDTSIIGGDVFANSRYANLPAGVSSATCGTPSNYCVQYKYHTEAKLYHDISVTKKFASWNGTITAGVHNLFDEPPPLISTGEFRIGDAALNGYDMIGRQYFVSVKKSF